MMDFLLFVGGLLSVLSIHWHLDAIEKRLIERGVDECEEINQ